MKKHLLLALLCLSSASLVGHGQLDTSFGVAGVEMANYDQQDDINRAVALQKDGKIVTFGSINGPTNNQFAVARYNSNGKPDTSFHSTGLPNSGEVTVKFNSQWASYGGSAFAGAIQNDGKIIAVGTAGGATAQSLVIARLLSDGNLDRTFNPNGVGSQPGTRVVFLNTPSALATGVAIQPDGKIVVVGYAGNADNHVYLLRLLSNGTPDPSFNNSGLLKSIPGGAFGVALQHDGKIVVVGTTGNDEVTNYFVARYLPNGSFDTSFNGNGIVTGNFGVNNKFKIASISIQPDNKIVIGGYANESNFSTTGFALIRLLPNGRPDTSFNRSGTVVTHLDNENINCYGRQIALQKDGKIIVGGSSSDFSGVFTLARYNSNGSLDTSFGSDSGIPGFTFTNFSDGQGSGIGYGITIQPDGKIILVGQGTNGNGQGLIYSTLARYMP